MRQPGRRAANNPADQHWQRSQRAGRRWALWGSLMGLLLGVAMAAPAPWLASALNQASGGRMLLAQARGSVWTGSALLVLTGGPGSRDAATLPDRLHWQLRPGWQGLRLQLAQTCCIAGQLTFSLQPGWSGLRLTLVPETNQAPTPTTTQTVEPGPAAVAAAQPTGLPGDAAGNQALAFWPASLLAGLGTPWNTLQLGGSLQLSSAGLNMHSRGGQWQLGGDLALDLLNMSSRLSPLPALGSYRVELQGGTAAGDAARLQLRTLGGALQIDGSGQFTATGLRFRGSAQAAPGQEAALANLLNIIGRRQGALSVISIG